MKLPSDPEGSVAENSLEEIVCLESCFHRASTTCVQTSGPCLGMFPRDQLRLCRPRYRRNALESVVLASAGVQSYKICVTTASLRKPRQFLDNKFGIVGIPSWCVEDLGVHPRGSNLEARMPIHY